MLYWLLYLKLFHYFPPFRIFRYLTFRTAFASLTALFTGLIVGPIVIGGSAIFRLGSTYAKRGRRRIRKKRALRRWAGCLLRLPFLCRRCYGRI